MSIVDTTRTVAVGRSTPPVHYAKRISARILDSIVTGIIALALSWWLVSGPLGQALTSNGFSDYAQFIQDFDWRHPLNGAAGLVLNEVQPVLVTAIALQLAVAWVYEAGFTILTGATPGKAAQRLRVVLDEPLAAGPGTPRPGLLARTIRLGVRALLVVGPPVAAVATTAAAALGVPGAGRLSEITIAATVLFLALWLAGGRGVHGMVSGSTVLPFSWAQARLAAERGAAGYVDAHRDQIAQTMARSGAARDAMAQLRMAGVRTPTAQESLDRLNAAGGVRPAVEGALHQMSARGAGQVGASAGVTDTSAARQQHLKELLGEAESAGQTPAGRWLRRQVANSPAGRALTQVRDTYERSQKR